MPIRTASMTSKWPQVEASSAPSAEAGSATDSVLGVRTGWSSEGRMAQDDSRELSRWLSNRLGARHQIKGKPMPEFLVEVYRTSYITYTVEASSEDAAEIIATQMAIEDHGEEANYQAKVVMESFA